MLKLKNSHWECCLLTYKLLDVEGCSSIVIFWQKRVSPSDSQWSRSSGIILAVWRIDSTLISFWVPSNAYSGQMNFSLSLVVQLVAPSSRRFHESHCTLARLQWFQIFLLEHGCFGFVNQFSFRSHTLRKVKKFFSLWPWCKVFLHRKDSRTASTLSNTSRKFLI